MQNYTLMIVWHDGSVTQTPFATRQLAMAGLDDIQTTADWLRDTGTLSGMIRSAVILVNAPESIEPTRKAKS